MTTIFFQENALENVYYKIKVILLRSQCVKNWCLSTCSRKSVDQKLLAGAISSIAADAVSS